MKFYALVFNSDMTLNRYWMNNDDVISLLKEDSKRVIYRTTNDQRAILTDSGELFWQDVTSVDFKKAE